MLVLARKVSDVINIGDKIRITIVDIRGDKVRIGVDAPRDMPVHRKEVADAIGLRSKAGLDRIDFD